MVDLAMLRLRGVLAPEYCVMNVLGMVLPESLILYLFFFYFSWIEGWAPVLKMEAVDHRAYPWITNPDFFWATP